MAVTEKLIVDMQADTKDFTKSMSMAEKATKDLSKSFDDAAKSNENLEKNLKIAGEAYAKLKKNYTEAYKQMDVNSKAYDSALKGNIDTTKNFEDAVESSNKKMNFLQKSILSVQSAMLGLNLVFSSIHIALELFNGILSGNLIKNLRTFLSLLALVADFKGYEKTAEIFDKLVASLDSAILKLESFNIKYQQLIGSIKNGDVIVEKSRTLLNVFEGAFNTAAIGAFGFGINKIGQNFKVYRENINPVIKDTMNLGKSWGFSEHLLTAKMTPSLIRFSEILWTFSKPMTVASGLLLTLDDAFLNFGGSIGLVAAGVGATVGLFFTALIHGASNLASALGGALLNSLAQAELKFEKFQSTMNQFTFTIDGFGKALGVDAVGTVDHWMTVLQQLRKTTTFTTEDIAKSIKFLVAEGSRFGLTIGQIETLIQRTADVSAAYGENIVDTSMKMNAAFAGSSQALQNMGFAVSDAYFSSSDYFLSLGKTTEQLTKQEIAATRLDLIMKETAAITGAAANATKTLSGSSAVLERSMTDLQSSLGETSGFLTNLQAAVVSNISSLVDFSKPLISIIGTLQEWLGIGLVLTGFLLKQFFHLTFYTQLWIFLTNVLKTNLTVQKLLDVAFLKLGKTMNFTAVSVVSMTTLMQNLGLFLKKIVISTVASLTIGMKVFAASVLAASASVFRFTMSLLTNPLFIKGALIVGALVVLGTAIKETVQEIEFLTRVFDDTSEAATAAGGNIVDAGVSMAKVFGSTMLAPFKALFKILVDISKYIIGGVVAAILVLASAFALINRAVRFMANGFKESVEDAAAFDEQMQEIALRLGQTSHFIRKTGTEINKSFGGTALGATLGKSVAEVEAQTKKSADTLEKYVKLHMVGFDQSAEKVAELGNEYDRLALNQKKAQIALAETYKTNLDLNEKSKKIAEARIELIKAEIAVEKQRQATINEIESQRKSIELDILKRTGQTTKAINMEFADKINNVIKEEQALSKIGKLRLEDQIIINQNIKLAEKARKLSISEEVQKQNEIIIGLEKNILEIRKEAGNQNALELKNIVDKYVEKEKELGLEQKKLAAQGKSNDKVKELIALAKQANTEAGKVAVREFELAKFKEAKTQLDELNSQILDLTGLELDKIDEKLKKDLEALAIKREEFELSYKMANLPIPKNRLEVYKKQEAALKRIAKINTDKAPSREFEGAKQVGTDVAQGITQAFQSGTAGAVMGAMTGVGAVADVVQGLIDFVPALLDKISNIFNSIVELPQKIVDGVGKLFDSILNYVANYIPKLLEAIPKLFEKFTSFFEKLPDVFANLLTNLPDMLTGLLDRLPDLVENFVEKLIQAAPKIVVSLVKFLVTKAPYIAMELSKAMAIEIPLAIIRGILDAIKSLPKIFSQLGKSILPKPAEIAKTFALGIKAAAKTLTGVASKLFAVMDLEDGAKSNADRLGEFAKTADRAIGEGVEKIRKGSEDLWKGLVDAWRWVYDNIIIPIFNGIRAVWLWVYDKVITPIVEAIRAVWLFVYDKVIMPLVMGIREVWLFVYDKVIMPIIDGLRAVWLFVYEKVVLPLVDGIKAVWEFVNENIIKPLVAGLGAVWAKAKELLDPIVQAFKDAFEGIKTTLENIIQGLKDAFNAGISGLKDAGQNIKEKVEAAATAIKDALGAVGDLGGRIWNGFKDQIDRWDFGAIGGKIWNGLKGGLDQIGGLISNQLNGINPANIFSKIFSLPGDAFGNRGPVEKQLKFDMPFMEFAKGGMVPGKGGVPNDSRINDRIVALLSAGEAVIPKSKMDDPAVAGIVQGILSGKIGAPAYALGGVVGGLKKMGGDIAGAFQETIAPVADILDPAKILEQAWASMKGLVWDKVLDMFWTMLSRNKFHDGGLVPGSGEMPSMLKGGEFVLNKSAASSIGVPTLNDLNAGKAPSNNTQNIELNLVINTTQPIDATMIKNKIMPVIREELKRASIDGRTTIYQSGVRTA